MCLSSIWSCIKAFADSTFLDTFTCFLLGSPGGAFMFFASPSHVDRAYAQSVEKIARFHALLDAAVKLIDVC